MALITYIALVSTSILLKCINNSAFIAETSSGGIHYCMSVYSCAGVGNLWPVRPYHLTCETVLNAIF